MAFDYCSVINTHFPQLAPIQVTQFAALSSCYDYWNQRINLISRKDIGHLYVRHILHSLSIAKLMSFKSGTTVLDVGTGGGFPGIPLAIYFPQTHFVLVDSTQKKVKAVQRIAEEIKLNNVTTQWIRAEQVCGSYDFVVGRGVTKPFRLYTWIKDRLKKQSLHTLQNGVLYLQGNEVEDVPPTLWQDVYPIRTWFSAPFFTTKVILHLYPKEAKPT